MIVLDHRDNALEADDIALIDDLVRRLAPVPVVRIWGREPDSAAADDAVVARIATPALTEGIGS